MLFPVLIWFLRGYIPLWSFAICAHTTHASTIGQPTKSQLSLPQINRLPNRDIMGFTRFCSAWSICAHQRKNGTLSSETWMRSLTSIRPMLIWANCIFPPIGKTIWQSHSIFEKTAYAIIDRSNQASHWCSNRLDVTRGRCPGTFLFSFCQPLYRSNFIPGFFCSSITWVQPITDHSVCKHGSADLHDKTQKGIIEQQVT